jgi:UDP-N-acetylglucosamine transferase subunit ALG13
MIFVTTGTQLPFNRMLGTIEKWAERNQNKEVIAQTCKSDLRFKWIKAYSFLQPKEYSDYIKRADVIVGHAGMGTIITALEHSLPVIVMARRFELGEHRNDHQLSTVAKFQNRTGIYIANDEKELEQLLYNIRHLKAQAKEPIKQRRQLVDFLYSEIRS